MKKNQIFIKKKCFSKKKNQESLIWGHFLNFFFNNF